MSSSQFTGIRRMMVASILVSMVAACGHEPVRRLPQERSATPVDRGGIASGRHSAGDIAAIAATGQIGVPYRYGGSTTRGFDCSGLVQYAWAKAGVKIPRTTASQWKRMSPVRRNEMQNGDLLFFRIGGRVSHVGMYVGNGRFVHAPSSGRKVSVESLETDYYRETFAGAARP